MVTKTKAAVTLVWGIGYTITGYIVQSHDKQITSEVERVHDESGSTVGYAFYDNKTTLKVGGLIQDGTELPAVGDEMTVNGTAYIVLPPISEKRDAKGFTAFEMNLERAEDNVIPNDP